MPPKVQKSKAAKLLAAQSASKGRKGKKKWAKTRAREKKNHAVGINKSLHDSVLASAAKKTKYVTLYTLIANYAVGGAVARKLVKELAAAGTIRKVVGSGSLAVYAPKA